MVLDPLYTLQVTGSFFHTPYVDLVSKSVFCSPLVGPFMGNWIQCGVHLIGYNCFICYEISCHGGFC